MKRGKKQRVMGCPQAVTVFVDQNEVAVKETEKSGRAS